MKQQQENKALLCLTALCLPKTQWAANFLRALGCALHIADRSSVDGAITMTYSSREETTTSESMLDRAEAMAASLRSTMTKDQAVRNFVTILLLVLRGKELAAVAASHEKNKATREQMMQRYEVLSYDARTSVILRRLALLLRIKLSAVCALEEIAIREMQKESALIQKAAADSEKKGEKSSWMRTAKIGAAATAAGGLMFVTGGLAAPALATGLASLGLVGATTYATTATVATLLGGAGAGLGAYKMARRTKGLTTFEFHKINGENSDDDKDEEIKGMTVYICISGLLRQAAPVINDGKGSTGTTNAAQSPDFYGPWGAQPPRMSPAQTLDRFYSVVAPDKRQIVPLLLQRYAGKEDELMEKLAHTYNVHPKSVKPESSRPSHFLKGKDADVFKQLLSDVILEVKNMIKAQKDDSSQPSELLVSQRTLDVIIDSEKAWDDTVQVPKLQVMDRSEAEDTIKSKEEIEKVLAEMDKRIQEAPKSRTVDKHIMDCLVDEIELLDIEDIVPTDKLTVGSTTVSGSVVQRPRYDEVYWWRESIANYGDQYTIVWEPEKLLEIGHCVEDLIKEGVNKGIKKSLQYTALSAVLSAVAMPLSIASLVGSLDENWTVTTEAANEAGLLLADALLSSSLGKRPVVLVGYSVGGRVVAKALTRLAEIADGTSKENSLKDDFEFVTESIESDSTISEEERKRRLRAATVVRDAVIIGAPCDTSAAKWAQRRSVVLGRLINVYCPSDWVLSLLYRYKRWSVIPLAGLREVTLPPKDSKEDTAIPASPIENFDVSDIVDSHGDYPSRMKDILRRVGLGDVECDCFHPNYFLRANQRN